MRVAIAAALLTVVAACSPDQPTAPDAGCSAGACASATPAPREAIGDIRDYVVYYGSGELDSLSRFDLAIIDPSTLSSDDIAVLRGRGALVVGYLSVGEIAAGDPWLVDGTVPREWILGRNRNWGSLFVDASREGWQRLMREEMGDLIDQGFDGVFLDTVDTAIDVAPETKDGMEQLIRGLREAYPDALIVQNRGFAIAEDVADAIDAVMFEDLSTSYDFDRAEYVRVDNSGEANHMVELHERTGLPILALDYADAGDSATANRAVRIARSYGFVPAVSVIALDEIPDYRL
jgi:uncharacterized protein (TIGR01370 family)